MTQIGLIAFIILAFVFVFIAGWHVGYENAWNRWEDYEEKRNEDIKDKERFDRLTEHIRHLNRRNKTIDFRIGE